MSFLGNKQIKGDLKLVDNYDENLKNKIKDKLNELTTKNTLLSEKVINMNINKKYFKK
jgi:hypothetical protein